MSEEEQELKIAEWLYRSNIPTLAQELINRIYENDDDDDDDSSDNSGKQKNILPKFVHFTPH